MPSHVAQRRSRTARWLAVFALLAATRPVVGQSRSVYIEELTWPEVRDAMTAGRTNAIIYAGSTEQNGPHMVLGKHNFIAHDVAGRIAAQLGTALVYPTLPFAPAGDPVARTGHMRFPGTVSIAPATYRAIVRDVAASALVAGFKNVFIMGDHGGGQVELQHAAEELDSAWAPRGSRVFYVGDLYFVSAAKDSAYLAQHGLRAGGHANADDTSQLMYVGGGDRWIRRDKLAASDSALEPTTGVDGDPRKASRAFGRVFIDFKVAAAVAQIRKQLQSSAP